jgi:hypothetical protein
MAEDSQTTQDSVSGRAAMAKGKADWCTPRLMYLGQVGLKSYLNNTGRCMEEQWACVAAAILENTRKLRPLTKRERGGK